jgi:hypothetical protein
MINLQKAWTDYYSQVQHVYNKKYFVEECCTHEIWGPRLRILQPTLNTVQLHTDLLDVVFL